MTRKDWLQAQISSYEDASNIAIQVISQSFDEFDKQKGIEQRCVLHDTYGTCAADSTCQVVVVNEGPVDNKDAVGEKEAKKIDNVTHMCLGKEGQEAGRWRYDKDTGKVLILNADGSIDKVQSSNTSWIKDMFRSGVYNYTPAARFFGFKSVAENNAALADKVLDAAFGAESEGVALLPAAKARELQRRIVLLDAKIRPLLKAGLVPDTVAIGVYQPDASGDITCTDGALATGGALVDLASAKDETTSYQKYLDSNVQTKKAFAMLKALVEEYTRVSTQYQQILQEISEENKDQATEIAGIVLGSNFKGAQKALSAGRAADIKSRQKLYFLMNCAAYCFSDNEEVNYYWYEDRTTMEKVGSSVEEKFNSMSSSRRNHGIASITLKRGINFSGEATNYGNYPARDKRLAQWSPSGSSTDYNLDAFYMRKRYTDYTIKQYIADVGNKTAPLTLVRGNVTLTGTADSTATAFVKLAERLTGIKNESGYDDAAARKDTRSIPVVRINGKYSVDPFMNEAYFPGKQLFRDATKQTVSSDAKIFSEQRIKLAARNRDMRKMANMDFADASDLMAKIGLKDYFAEDRSSERAAKRKAGKESWLNYGRRKAGNLFGFNRMRGGDDTEGSIRSMSTAGDHESSSPNSTTLASMVSEEESLSSGAMVMSEEESFSELSAGGDASLSLMSTEIPGQPPRMAKSEEESFANNSFGTVSLMSTATPHSKPRMMPKETFTASVVQSEEEFLEKVSGTAASSPVTASLDVDRVYEEFYAGADLQSTASSVSHLY